MADKSKTLNDFRIRLKDLKPPPEEPDFLSDETLMRFLKARDFHLDDSEKLIRATVEWRIQYRPKHVDCRWCHEKPGFHSMRQVGFDLAGRPVIYSCFAQAATHKNSVEDSIAHVAFLIESSKTTMVPGVLNWVFILDCSGMSLPACNPKLGYGVTQVLSNHYPERLGLVIGTNHSPVFQGVWKAIKVFLHPNTADKVQLERSKKKVKELFIKHFPDDLAEWLIQEIKLNKESPLPQSQKYFWKAPEKDGQHDPRGCPSYVKQFIQNYDANNESVDRHRIHPNIADEIRGTVSGTASSTPEEIRAEDVKSAAATGNWSDVDGELDEQFEELSIDPEYLIPDNAKPL